MSTGLSRKFQSQLRRDLLILYEGRCSICGLDIPSFLITSHIVPVGTDPSIAADRRNCILLCTLHDKAYENGLIYFDDNYQVQINPNYIKLIKHPLLKLELLKRRNQKLRLPIKFTPKVEYLHRHRTIHNIT